MTSILHCHWLKFWCKCKMQIKNYERSKPEIRRLLLDIIVFRLVAYLLNMICLNILLLYKIVFIYKFSYHFDTVFYHFLETGISDIDVWYVLFNAWDSQVSSYTPFQFSFAVSLKLKFNKSNWQSTARYLRKGVKILVCIWILIFMLFGTTCTTLNDRVYHNISLHKNLFMSHVFKYIFLYVR